MSARRIQIRRGTTEQWTAANPVLAAGEPAVDLTTGFFYIGDGSTPWNALVPFDPEHEGGGSGGGGGSVLSVDGRTGSVTLSDLYEPLGSASTVAGSLANVATSGSYNDLTGRPTLGTAAAANTADFATSAQGALADSAVQPDDLTPAPVDSVDGRTGIVTLGDTYEPIGAAAALAASLSAVATSGAYNDLTGRPTLATVATSGAYNDLSGRPALAAVATSGSYDDLSNKPAVGVWQFVAEATPSGIATVNFGNLLEWEEIQIRYQGRTANTGGSQSNLLLRFNGDTGANYNGTQTGRIVATTTNSNQTAQTGIFVGYLASEQTNANRWGTGTINFLKQPATSRKLASYETTVGQSTGENMGNISGGIEWTNTTDAITSITLYALTNFVAGTKFTVLGRA
jgi:hypothetical protein